MGKTRGPYKQEYPTGSVVKIADREALEYFLRTWKLAQQVTVGATRPCRQDREGKVVRVLSWRL